MTGDHHQKRVCISAVGAAVGVVVCASSLASPAFVARSHTSGRAGGTAIASQFCSTHVKEVFLSEQSSRLHSSSRLSLSPALHRDVRVLSLHSLFYFSISLRR